MTKFSFFIITFSSDNQMTWSFMRIFFTVYLSFMKFYDFWRLLGGPNKSFDAFRPKNLLYWNFNWSVMLEASVFYFNDLWFWWNFVDYISTYCYLIWCWSQEFWASRFDQKRAPNVCRNKIGLIKTISICFRIFFR